MLLVVIEDALDRLDARIIVTLIGLPGRLLVPVENLMVGSSRVGLRKMTETQKGMTHSADERRNQSHASLRTCNGLPEAEEKGEVAVNAFVALELARSLDTFPGRRDLDEHTFPLDSDGLVKRNKLFGLGLGSLLVKGETGIDFSGDTAGNDGKDLFAEFDELEFHVSGNTFEKMVPYISPGGLSRRRPAVGWCHPSACRI
jgi:hypothetical protein